MIALYPFQAEALGVIESAVAAGARRLLLAWATGLGKTVAFAHVVARRPGRALVLAHRDELVQQAVAKLRLVMPEAPVGIVQAERDELDLGKPMTATSEPAASTAERKGAKRMKKPTKRKRCKRCGHLWPWFAGRQCPDCDRQENLSLEGAPAGAR